MRNGPGWVVRPAQVGDVARMAQVHVRCWQETYRGLMPDALLDNPDFPAARERMWAAALTGERYRQHRIAVVDRDDQLIGIAMAAPASEIASARTMHLGVLYVYTADHGTGVGQALLEAVISPDESATLWVVDPNPRAQAFYRKNGFTPDGTAKAEDGVQEIRMHRNLPCCLPGMTCRPRA
jgi:GNAT superfamily N-acetyltransferase